MAYDNERRKYNKAPFRFIEIEVDATTYRFGENLSPLPNGFDGEPTLLGVSMSAAQIDLSGGFGLRASASVSISESMTFTEYGATIASPMRFWACWRAANPNYKNQRISVYSGYVPDNEFDISNFIRRDYIIDTFAWAKDGVQISLVDPLKLANNNNAKYPLESTGFLSLDINDVVTTATLAPLGIGDTEYPAASSGDSSTWYFVRINDEIMQVTNRASDTLTIVRGQFNTIASDHNADDTVQYCLYYDTQTVSAIAYDLVVNGAGIDPAYINQVAWDAESSANFPNTYDSIITEPTGVKDLIEEFSQSAPHYYYYDERVNKIQFVALKPPPVGGQLLTYEGNLLRGKVAAGDDQDARVSTVVIYFGIFNPVKDLDETSNYRQVYIREDSDSVTDYGSRAYKVIYSRWISNDGKTASVLAAARIGRRFASAPRNLSYELDAKDAEVWTGDNVRVVTDLILNDVTFDPAELTYQVISAKENISMNTFNYKVSEHTYGPAVDGDDDVEDPNVRLIYIAGEQDQLKDDLGNPRTLRELYDDEYPDIDPAYDVRFIIEPSAVVGSTTNTAYGINTGAFPELTTPILIDVRGLLLGKGGDGGDGQAGDGEDGGSALSLDDDVRINNSGIIGGGGGGGGRAINTDPEPAIREECGGGGGAGFVNGIGGVFAEDGTNTDGGLGNTAGFEPSGAGGDLGAIGIAGNDGTGGAAGAAIDRNGYTITYINAGDIRGTINA